MKNKAKHPIIIGLMILFGVIGQAVFTSSAIASTTIVPNQTYGATYGEFSARWWQWLLSIPAAVNPNLDATGDNCGQGQYDDVWFLAGAFFIDDVTTVTRTCNIPAGKPIFFPPVNTIVFKPLGKETLLSLRRQAGEFIDTVIELTVSIDGENVIGWSNFRVKSPSFTVIAPSKGLVPPGKLSVPGNTDPIVSDGYWLLLSALSVGTTHHINSHVVVHNPPPANDKELNLNYTINIIP